VISVALSLLLVLPAHLAWAAGGEVVERALLVVELNAGGDNGALTADYLKEIDAAIKASNAPEYVVPDQDSLIEKLRKVADQVPGALNDEMRASLSEGRKKGIELLQKKNDAKGAIGVLTGVEQRYRAALAAPGADDTLRKQYLEVLGNLAWSHIKAKDVDAAKEVFRIVATTFPEPSTAAKGAKAPINDNDYPPDIVEVYTQAVKELKAQKLGAVEVSSTPPGARVLLGGSDRGATPMTVNDLAPGQYSLRLQQGNATSLLHRVRIAAGATLKKSIDIGFESHLRLGEHRIGLAYSDLANASKAVVADAGALGKTLGVDVVMAVGVVDGQLVTFVVDAAKGQMVREGQTKVPQVGLSKRAAAGSVATLLGRESGEGAAIGVSGGGAGGGGGSIAVPAAVGGVGVLLAGVGVAYGLSKVTMVNGSEVSAWGESTVSSADKAEATDVQGSRQMTSGVLVGVGVAAIATGVVLFVMSKKSSSAAKLAPALPPVHFGRAPAYFAAR
jgi:hypothetical protein